MPGVAFLCARWGYCGFGIAAGWHVAVAEVLLGVDTESEGFEKDVQL